MWLLSLWVFSTGAIVSSLLVITSAKAINAIISLIIAFINGIGIFMLMGLDFIALIYCIVYVGAIAILFLFVIMLLSEHKEMPLQEKSLTFTTLKRTTGIHSYLGICFSSSSKTPMVILIGVLYIVVVWCGIAATSLTGSEKWSDVTDIYNHKKGITLLGEMLYAECGYELLLTISLILLVGMIGSIVLTLKKQ